MGQDFYSSDYGSASSSKSNSLWGSMEGWGASAGVTGAPPCSPSESVVPRPSVLLARAASFRDIGSSNIEKTTLEFQLNGCDSPYGPQEEQLGRSASGQLSGMGPAGGYLRQKSWPEPDRSPTMPLSSLRPKGSDGWADFPSGSLQWNSHLSITAAAPASPPQSDVITAEQLRVLQELPDIVLHGLLRDLQTERESHFGKKSNRMRLPEECRFCKNNGERELYYRSHVLKDPMGRVNCPVLRAFVCKRCGARGDTAHTIKYCPLSTYEERIHSVNMMRIVRLQSRRRRSTSLHSQVDKLAYMVQEPFSGQRYVDQSLDPAWAALEQKLML